MKGRLSNASLVAVLLVAFSLFVAGLTNSTDGDRSVRGGPATPTPTRTPTPVNIGNFVWSDLDKDGAQDAGEPGLPGVTVIVSSLVNGAVIDSAVTSATGIYTVTVPFPATYYLRVIAPPGAALSPKNQGGNDLTDSDANSNGWTDALVIASNVISTTTLDFGLIYPRQAYVPLSPARLLDTRANGVTVDGVNQKGRRAAGSILTLQVGGRGGVPLGAGAATLNLTAVQPAPGTGYVTMYPCTPTPPNSSVLNTSGATIANEIEAPLSDAGTVCIFTSVAMDLVVDVGGVFID